MATLEQVEKLRQKANVGYDEAKEALNACGDDLLEALIYLEKQGKVAPPSGGGYYSSKREYAQPADTAPDDGAVPTQGESLGSLVRRFWHWLRGLMRRSNRNHFEAWRRGERVLSTPVTILVILLIFCFWIILPLMLIGLFFGYTYRFRGPDLEQTPVNQVMDTVAQAADTIKREVGNSGHPDA